MEGPEVIDAAAAAGAQAKGNDDGETVAVADQPLGDEEAAAAGASTLAKPPEAVEIPPTVDSTETREIVVAPDQPLDDEAAAATGAEAAADVNLLEMPPNVDSPASEEIVKDQVAPESTTPESAESSPGEKKLDDGTANDEARLLSINDNLLNFGVSDGANIEEPNQQEETTASNDIDLLGFGSAQPETTGQASDAEAISPADDPSTNKVDESVAAGDNGPVHDLQGMSPEENMRDNAQQRSPEPANTIDTEPQNSPTEKEVNEDLREDTITDSQNESTPVKETDGEDKLEIIANEEGHNQSENENPNSPSVEEGDAPDTDPQKGNDSVIEIDTAGENQEPSPESNVNSNGEGLNQTEDKDASTVNEGNLVVEKKVDVSDELNGDQGVFQENDTKQDEIAPQELESTLATTEVDGSEDVPPQEKDSHENENRLQEPAPPPVTTVTAFSSENTSQQGIENGAKANNEADAKDSASPAVEEAVVEERTEEEEEWLSMGLGLGDALRQIVALTEEKDSALTICQQKEDGKVQAEALLVEFQSRLEAEMNKRAEYESEVRQARETIRLHEARLETYEKMEDDLEQAQASIVKVVSEKSKIELEVQKLREIRDQSEQKEVVLSNRLNDAKKKEANKITAAGRLEAGNEMLRDDLKKTKEELEVTSKAKTRLENNMEKLKTKAVERVKQAETALAEERELNEERKKKMKMFVETKADELREAKDSFTDMQKELEETRGSLRSSRDREETYQKELDAARLKHRELQRDMERMKRSSEQLHRMGNSLGQELEKSANETEEHKKKRMTAKHEIMQMVRTLEAERTVSSKLRESVKFTFTPKALSQQELLTEALRDFELELEKLAAKMGKSLLPSAESSERGSDLPLQRLDSTGSGSAKKSRRRGSKADVDTERLVSNLEQETQSVSKGIMALAGSIERMRSLLDDDNMFGCMTYFSNIIAGTGEARHERLGDEEVHEESGSDHFV